MSNLETDPAERQIAHPDTPTLVTVLLPAREVPLGGVRAMSVSRTLPTKTIPLIGAWCFLDQMGPERVEMRVRPHPHIGLQTVTWPLAGQIRHRDNLGTDTVLKPGQLNLMTSGAGVSHSEYSLGIDAVLHGLQLWVALPAAAAHGPAGFEQHVDLPVLEHDGLRAIVFVGELGDVRSPAAVHSPLVGADLTIERRTTTTLPLRPDFEHGVLLLEGNLTVGGVALEAGPLLYLGTGRSSLEVESTTGARFVLIGGEPFPDELVMWWNFVGRSHEEIVTARDDWEGRSERFGQVAGHGTDRIPAPPMPPLRLTPRRRTL